MSAGNPKRQPRDMKYAEVVISKPKEMVGLHGWRRNVFPEAKAIRHGHRTEKPQPREDRWR